MSKCNCRFCAIEYPEFKAILLNDSVEDLHTYIKKIFECWQMADEEVCWLRGKISELKESGSCANGKQSALEAG